MSKAATIRTLAAARCSLAEIMAATGCDRDYCCQYAPQLAATPRRRAGSPPRRKAA